MPCFFVFNKRVTGTRVGTRCVRGRKRLNGLRRGDSIVFHRGYTNRTLTRRIEQIRVIGGWDLPNEVYQFFKCPNESQFFEIQFR